MSGTKLLSQPAPATKAIESPALLIVAHGERGGNGDDQLVHDIVKAQMVLGRYRTVRACFLSKEPSLETVFSGLPPGPVNISPLFMSDGYFAKQAIPKMLGANSAGGKRVGQVNVATPIGLSPHLPTVVSDLAKSTAKQSGAKARDCRLLLVAHGSKHDCASHNATASLAGVLDDANIFAGVEYCFLDEYPFMEESLADIEGPAIALGLFIGQGMHGAEDLPRAIKKTGRTDIFMSSPLAQWPGLMQLICNDLVTEREDGRAIKFARYR